MAKIKRVCLRCQKKFTTERKEVNRGFGKFCSRSCSASRSRTSKNPNVTCAYCHQPFYKRRSQMHNSKSGLFFCCRQHKDLAQRIGGIEAIQPDHYKNGVGARTGRVVARRNLPLVCCRCGYGRETRILEVHHRDRKRHNNDLSNLEILCPNCHAIEHLQVSH